MDFFNFAPSPMDDTLQGNFLSSRVEYSYYFISGYITIYKHLLYHTSKCIWTTIYDLCSESVRKKMQTIFSSAANRVWTYQSNIRNIICIYLLCSCGGVLSLERWWLRSPLTLLFHCSLTHSVRKAVCRKIFFPTLYWKKQGCRLVWNSWTKL